MLYKIKTFLREQIIWRFQRAKKGYADVDVWSVDNWLLTVLPKVLRELAESVHGWPDGQYKEITSFEEWQDAIKRIAYLLEEANEETCHLKNEYEDEFYIEIEDSGTVDENHVWTANIDPELSKLYYKREKELFKYRNKCKNEAFDMIKRYFWSLWD